MVSTRYLQTLFPDRLISRSGYVPSAPRSPDLISLDFFLWEYLKEKVYVNRPSNSQFAKKSNSQFAKQISQHYSQFAKKSNEAFD